MRPLLVKNPLPVPRDHFRLKKVGVSKSSDTFESSFSSIGPSLGNAGTASLSSGIADCTHTGKTLGKRRFIPKIRSRATTTGHYPPFLRKMYFSGFSTKVLARFHSVFQHSIVTFLPNNNSLSLSNHKSWSTGPHTQDKRNTHDSSQKHRINVKLQRIITIFLSQLRSASRYAPFSRFLPEHPRASDDSSWDR